MYEMIGKLVEVIADDVVYRGKLIEVNENVVHLQAETGWLVISTEKIMKITLIE
jgi:hypothetical protein